MAGKSLDLNLIRSFVAVADAGSFTSAADLLGVGRPMVSLHVARLEKSLGVRLFDRTTRHVALTDAGSRLLERSAPLLRALLEVADAEGAAAPDLQGRLRISAPVDHAAQVLAPVLVEFSRLHPRLEIELRASDKVGDLVTEGIDVAFRLGWLRNSSLRASKLGDFEQGLVAAPGYLDAAGVPSHPDDLVHHAWVALTLLRSALTWQFRGPKGHEATVRMKALLRTDSPLVLRALLMTGAGISAMALLHVQRELHTGELVRVLPKWALPPGGVFAVFPPGSHIPARSQALVDFVRQQLSAQRHPPR